MGAHRPSTSTSSFGAGRRENHDSSRFYARFTPPEISSADNVHYPPAIRDEIRCGQAQDLLATQDFVTDNSVALIVTSPPYFVGKAYEEAMGEGHVPVDYSDHLQQLFDVLAICTKKLEPGGRIAVNVANLGRRPYRSQASDVLRIFEDLGLLLRGEIVWQKSEGLSGSTAWGSFQSAANPVLRDMTERIIVASKGRFDRAIPRKQREQRGLPHVSTVSREAFMRNTTDVWRMDTESASRVNHPAPFPVSLPRRLIELYTYEGDLILDPYMGSGTTAVAALATQRHFVGCETDPAYVEAASERIAAERERLDATKERRDRLKVALPPVDDDTEEPEPLTRAVREGRKAEYLAEIILTECGFTVEGRNRKLSTGIEIDFVATAPDGSRWHFDVTGAFTSERSGLRRTDTLWKSLGKAAMREPAEDDGSGPRLILLTTDLPSPSSVGMKALRAARKHQIVLDAVEMLTTEGQERLREYAAGGAQVDEPIGELLAPSEPDALF